MTLNNKYIADAIDHVLAKIDQNLETYTHKFPAPSSENQVYPLVDNVNWTNAFWTGMLWLAFEVTGDEKYRKVAEIHVKSFGKRLEDRVVVDHHDLGFLYTLSCVSAYKLTGNEEAKKIAVDAADYLLGRYHEKAEILQAWGDIKSKDSKEKGRMIIDCNMNLPLLYWASEVTGDHKYKDIAKNHIKQAQKYIVREDYSTYHTYYMDPETGAPIKGTTHQGYSDESCWTRGHAWGIYGFLLSHIYINDDSLVALSKNLSDYYMKRLADDDICYWDLIFTEGNQEKDSSSAAIAVCGLMELVKHLPKQGADIEKYEKLISSTLESLFKNYTTDVNSKSNGLLKHGVYNKNENKGVDESCLWGDYFYFEALVRAKKEWALYW